MDHPIVLRVAEGLERNRLTTLFRLILAIPHIVWLAIWGIAAYLAVVVSWFATLFAGRTPDGLHEFIARFLRYSTQVSGYLGFLGDAYPGFAGGPYEADLEIAPPAPQRRLVTLFRIILAIPALVVSQVLGYLLALLSFIAWIVILVTGRIPAGLRDLIAFCTRFTAQTNAYVMLLTERYPSFTASPVA